jgi:hypothetical protein
VKLPLLLQVRDFTLLVDIPEKCKTEHDLNPQRVERAVQKALALGSGALARRCLESPYIDLQDLALLNKLAGLALSDADAKSVVRVLMRMRQLERAVLLRTGVAVVADPAPIAGALRLGEAFRPDPGSTVLTWSGLRLCALAAQPPTDDALLTAVSSCFLQTSWLRISHWLLSRPPTVAARLLDLSLMRAPTSRCPPCGCLRGIAWRHLSTMSIVILALAWRR